MQDAIAQLIQGRTLDEAAAERVFQAILAGEADDAQIGALLALIQRRGASVDELVGAARVMRANVTRVPFSGDEDRLIDTCGTGGAPKTFNVSTAAAIVAAAAGASQGVKVAKHGNRSRTGRGSAEALAELGVNVDASPEMQARCLDEAGVCFCFAIHHHPAMKHAISPRKALGVPTIFNLLGPLTNPAGASRQMIGVYHPSLVEPVAHALMRLGARRALVVHGADGLDEITICAPTIVASVTEGSVSVTQIDTQDFGIERATLAQLQAKSLEDAVRIVRRAISGQGGAETDFVVANAAGALVVAGVAADFGPAVALARDAIDSGTASQTLDTLIRVSNS
jgi:anthranilate phosphoribosyltransferase